ARRPGHHRRRRAARQRDQLRLRRDVHQSLARAACRGTGGDEPGDRWPGVLRLRRLGGQRDRDQDGPPVPARVRAPGQAQGHRAMAELPWQHARHPVPVCPPCLPLSALPAGRDPYLPTLRAVPHLVPPSCSRCPLGHVYPGCGVACADDLERTILMEGPGSVAAFIAEPVIGSTVTAVVPVPGYYRRIREICDAYDVLFIADEVLTRYGPPR